MCYRLSHGDQWIAWLVDDDGFVGMELLPNGDMPGWTEWSPA